MAPVISVERRAKLQESLNKFLDASLTRSQDVDKLDQYLDYQPRTLDTQDPLPVDEMEERFQIAVRVEQDFGMELTVLQLSIIMTLPLETLRQYVVTLGIDIPFDGIHRFVRICTLSFPF